MAHTGVRFVPYWGNLLALSDPQHVHHGRAMPVLGPVAWLASRVVPSDAPSSQAMARERAAPIGSGARCRTNARQAMIPRCLVEHGVRGRHGPVAVVRGLVHGHADRREHERRQHGRHIASAGRLPSRSTAPPGRELLSDAARERAHDPAQRAQSQQREPRDGHDQQQGHERPRVAREEPCERTCGLSSGRDEQPREDADQDHGPGEAIWKP